MAVLLRHSCPLMTAGPNLGCVQLKVFPPGRQRASHVGFEGTGQRVAVLFMESNTTDHKVGVARAARLA